MSPPLRRGDVLEVTPDRWGDRGESLVNVRGWELRVEGGIPSEKARVRVTHLSTGAQVAVGEVISLPHPSPERRTPPCPLHGRCTGCGLQHVMEGAALRRKAQGVVTAFAEKGLGLPVGIPSLASPRSFGYRTKEILLPWGQNRRLILGARPSRAEFLIETKDCAVLHPAVERGAARCRGILAQAFAMGRLPLAGTDIGLGLRAVVLRGNRRGEVVATLVHRGDAPGSGLPEVADILCGGTIIGVYLQRHDAVGNAVTGPGIPVLRAGKGPLREKLLGMLFEVPPASFFQVNPEVAEGLYGAMVERAQVPRGGRVLELFCGAGVAGIAVANAAGASLLGVDLSPHAIACAEGNARANGLYRARFQAGRVEDVLPSLLAEGEVDVAIVNPPRAGVPESALRALAASHPKRVLYMSCFPETLARDSLLLAELGYRVESFQAADLLPQTPHVEVLVAFSPGEAIRIPVPEKRIIRPVETGPEEAVVERRAGFSRRPPEDPPFRGPSRGEYRRDGPSSSRPGDGEGRLGGEDRRSGGGERRPPPGEGRYGSEERRPPSGERRYGSEERRPPPGEGRYSSRETPPIREGRGGPLPRREEAPVVWKPVARSTPETPAGPENPPEEGGAPRDRMGSRRRIR